MLQYTEPVRISARKRQELLSFALVLARKAGKVTLRHFRSDLQTSNKATGGQFDPATEADVAAERLIRSTVHRSYPHHGILGEELGYEPGDGLTWVVDAIDGTRAYLAGMLHWGVLIALFDGHRPVLGVVHQPFTGEYFSGNGQTAWYQRGAARARLSARGRTALSQCVIATSSDGLARDPVDADRLARLKRHAMLFRSEGDCYAYALLAMGLVDVVADAGMRAWDVQALMPVITGSGGVISTVDGSDASMGGFIVAAANPTLHASVLEVLARR